MSSTIDGGTRAQDVRARVVRLFWLALVLRVAAAVVIDVAVPPQTFAPDQLTYDAVGRSISNTWSYDLAPVTWATERPGPQGYYYIVAFLYFLVGPYPIVPELVNALLGALTVPVVYDLAVRMGASVPAALRASAYTAWFPSLVLWSALNIRDVWIILLILLICREALILQARPGVMSLLLLAGGLLAVVQFRPYILFAVAGPVVVSFLVQRSRHVGRNLIIGSIAAAAVIYADQTAGENRRVRLPDLEEISEVRYWGSVGASSGFEKVDISTPGKAVMYLPKGLALFLLAPFPWMLGSIRQVLALPETLFFYWLIPWMLLGMRDLARHHLRTSLMALLIVGGLTLGYALGEGNAGTAYRHRAQLLSFFLIFAAVGQDMHRQRKLARHLQERVRAA
jgi:hypothetical protein